MGKNQNHRVRWLLVQDPNLRQLLDEVIREGDNRPRHYGIDPAVLPAISQHWADRRIGALSIAFSDFLRIIDLKIPSQNRSLGVVSAGVSQRSPFTRFINKSTEAESADLRTYLTTSVDFVYRELEAKKADAKSFYRGFNQAFSPIQDDLDVRQRVVDDMLADQVVTPPAAGSSDLAILKGHAGSGKTGGWRVGGGQAI